MNFYVIRSLGKQLHIKIRLNTENASVVVLTYLVLRVERLFFLMHLLWAMIFMYGFSLITIQNFDHWHVETAENVSENGVRINKT